MRIVPQTGTPPAAVTDSALTTAPGPTLTPGSIQRYTLQYRVLDLDPADANDVPAGLSATSLNITINDTSGGTLQRAQLTRFQAQLAGSTPPANPDTTGLPSGAAAGRTGVNAPFRGAFSDQNNNALPANGTITPNGIASILPLSISQNNQGNANNGIDNTAWYGLYTFNLTVGNVAGNYTITAEAVADPGTGNRFGWFNDGVAVPVQSANATTGVTHFRIGPGACCLNTGACSLELETACAGVPGLFLGAGTSCSPNPCPVAGACCFPGGSCASLVSTACTTQGGTFLGASIACGPGPCPPVRLELRLVPQAGDVTSPPGSGVVDLAVAPSPLLQGATQRFELQYRVLDMDASEPNYVPAGLAGASIEISADNPSGGSFARAQLSRFEAQLAGVTPPGTLDASGLPSGSAAVRQGVHVPFRGGFADANDNTLPSNGTVTPGGISNIVPLSVSQNNQGNANNGVDNAGWYGLYSFTYTANPTFTGDVVITAMATADQFTGNRFSWFNDGLAVPPPSANALAASVQLQIRAPVGACCSNSGSCTSVTSASCAAASGSYLGDSSACTPNPCPPALACCFASNACSILTSTACAAQSGLPGGSGSSCSPNICPPPYACCLTGFVCLLASTSSDCLAAGGTPLPRSTCVPQICCPSPIITQQPLSHLLIPPQPMSFTVAATHPGTLTYRWRKNGSNLNDDGRITGSTTPMLNISSTLSGDAGTYDAVITSSCGASVVSNAAVVTLCVSPSISTPPTGLDVCQGESAAFSVAALGTSPLTYQWRRNGMSLPGATGSTYFAALTGPGDAGSYDCVVTNPCGTATSSAATLAVNTAPTISMQPAATAACLGRPASLTVGASGGTRALSYQWRKEGADVPGAIAANYTIPAVAIGDAGNYDCRITSSCGTTISQTALLTVRTPPVVVTHPVPVSQCPGLSVNFTASATGLQPLTYQWRRNGSDIPGATAADFAIPHVTPADAGNYDCVITNSCASATTNAAALTVLTPASIASDPGSLTRCEGTAAIFTVTAVGSPTPSFQWRRGGVEISGATSSTFTIPAVTTADVGTYDCRASNICSTITSAPATLQVQTAPVISIHPQAQSPCDNGSATFSVTASGSAPLTYQWRFNGVPISGAISATFTINPVSTGNAGNYDCVVSNTCQNVTTNAAVLSIGAPPTITAHPLAQTVNANSVASLSVQATGTPPLQYQWRRDGASLVPSAHIPSVTAATLNISPVSPADEGLYDCIVTGPCGTVTTQLALLTVSCAGAGPLLDCNANQLCDTLELVGLRDITAPSPVSGDRFGWIVAVNGDRTVVGARTTDTPQGIDAGAAYIYRSVGGVSSLEIALAAPDGEPGAEFGNHVAIDGQWVFIAARFATVSGQPAAGAVYIYRNSGTAWTLFQKLAEPVPTSGAWFGHGVDVEADRAVVGAMWGTGLATRTGVAYVYRFNGINWAREATLRAPDGANSDGFGISVAIDDPYVAVSAPYDSDLGVNAGSAYVFFRSVSGWVYQDKLRPPFPQSNETFGEIVAISGDIVAVNAPRENVSGVTSAGAVHTYRRTDTRWTHQRKVVAPTPQANDLFGYYLAMDGDTMGVGGFLRQVAGIPGAGSVDVFRRRGNFWTRADRIESPKPEVNSWFGYAIGISGSRMVVGANGGTAGLVPNAGWVRVFDLGVLDCNDNMVPDVCEIASGAAVDADGNGIPDDCQVTQCRADFNDSGIVSVQDIFDFLADYFAGNLTADFNDSGILSVQDIFDFLTAYFAGCR